MHPAYKGGWFHYFVPSCVLNFQPLVNCSNPLLWLYALWEIIFTSFFELRGDKLLSKSQINPLGCWAKCADPSAWSELQWYYQLGLNGRTNEQLKYVVQLFPVFCMLFFFVCCSAVGHLVDMQPSNCQKLLLLWAKLNRPSWTIPRQSQLHRIKSHAKERKEKSI